MRRSLSSLAIAASLLLPFAGGTAPVASAAPAVPAVTSVRAAESQDGLTHLTLIPGQSEARYIMTVSTLGQPKAAACATRDVTGEIVLAPDGSVVAELSRITVDQRTLKCQAPLRDNMAQQLLQTAQHPMAEFKVSSAPGLGAPLPVGDAAFQLTGDQTVRGMTRPTVYESNANLTADSMVGQARTTFKMTTFGITPPSIGPLIQVSDDMKAEVDIKAMIAAPAAGAAMPAAPAPAADPAAGEPAAEEGEAPAAP